MNIVEHGWKGTKGLAGTVDRDLAKESIFNRIIFGGAGRIVTNHNREPKLVGQLHLNFAFPKPETTVVATARITENQERIFAVKVRPVGISPPLGDGIGG